MPQGLRVGGVSRKVQSGRDRASSLYSSYSQAKAYAVQSLLDRTSFLGAASGEDGCQEAPCKVVDGNASSPEFSDTIFEVNRHGI
jgi:hypothetical protein